LIGLRRVRWVVRATLTCGVAASVAANILHARPNPISQSIAAWPPLALLLTVELVSRVPVHRWLLATCRVLATVVISGIAAWVSYWHMAAVAATFGETDSSPYLLPVSVDGLIVVASISLVELTGRIRHTQTTTPASTGDDARTVPDPTVAASDAEPALDAALIAQAEQVAATHQARYGREITRDQLRAALRTSNATAGELLRLVRKQPTPGVVSAAGRPDAMAAIGAPSR
jgi:Protein of unknown function (DUF2637)